MEVDDSVRALVQRLMTSEYMTPEVAWEWAERILQGGSAIRDAAAYWVEYGRMPPWKVNGLDLEAIATRTGKASEAFAAALIRV
jgi:hypothetical protein